VVYDFDVEHDQILFLNDDRDSDGNETPDFDAENFVTDFYGDALITYADDSSILLDGVTVTEVIAAADTIFAYEYIDV
jgi:hypothetical protein